MKLSILVLVFSFVFTQIAVGQRDKDKEEGEEEQDRSSLCSKAVMIWFARDAMAAVSTSGDDDDEDFIAVVFATFLVTGLILSALPLLLGMQLRGGGQLRHWM